MQWSILQVPVHAILLCGVLLIGTLEKNYQMSKNALKRIEIGNSLLYCGNCFGILPILDVEAHAIITDPPFGITDCDWDKTLPFAQFWETVKSKTIPSANFVLFGCGKFTVDLITALAADFFLIMRVLRDGRKRRVSRAMTIIPINKENQAKEAELRRLFQE